MQFRLADRVCAANAMLDQFCAAAVADLVDYLTLGEPEERILDGKVRTSQNAEEACKSVENPRMGRPRCPRPDHLFADRQIQADDAVLIEADLLEVISSGDSESQTREQEGSRPLCVLLA
jgi:hypothetical protein